MRSVWVLPALSVLVAALWPQPRQISTGNTILKLSKDFKIAYDSFTPPGDLTHAVERTLTRLLSDKHQRLIVGRGETDASALKQAGSLESLTLSLTGPARAIAQESTLLIEERMEDYTLVVHDCTSALLTASSTLGLFRGLATFEQLWYEIKGEIYTYQAPIEIADAPSYPYRGFMLDTARNFYPVSNVKRTLDAMSWVKLNTFHWHIVDSQSFPLQIPGFLEIADKGAYSTNEVYSTVDVKDIVDYAAARGIDVIVEIDTPGHTAIIAESHPEHIACFHAAPWNDYAAETPAGQLRLASQATVDFTSRLLAAAARMTTSKYFSTGGDEVNMKCYEKDEQTQADLKASGKTLEEALASFTQDTHKTLDKEGKIPVVWEEMVLEHKIKLSKETLVMVWISSENAAKVTAKGFRVVQVPSNYFYLDCGAGEWLGASPNGNSWCDPFKTWQKASPLFLVSRPYSDADAQSYTFDPLENLPSSQHHLIIGGQHALWSEQSSPQNLDSIVWPRAASAAEVFWTGSERGTVSAALPRLHDLRYRMVKRGVRAVALQPHWCALRPGVCDISA